MNKVKIKGNKNIVVQENKQSNSKNSKTYTILGIIIACLSLLVTIIIGYDNIINFFTK